MVAEIIDFPPDDSAFDAGDLDARNGLAPTPFEWIGPKLLPKRQWLYGRHLIRKYVSATIAPGGLGKSSLVMAESLAMASGRGILGEFVAEPLRVWYWNGEDGQDENRYRMVAVASHYEISPDAFAPRLFHDTGREKDIVIGRQERNGFGIDGEVVQEIIRHVIANRIDVLIIDPFVAVHLVGENDNGPINAIVRAFALIAEKGNCAVELVHHIRKPGSGVSTPTVVEDARGASALIGGVRSARVLNLMSEDEADMFRIKSRFSYFRVDDGKANLAPRSETALWRRIVGFDLGNGADGERGDSIGVVEAWEPPGLFSGVPQDALVQAQRILAVTAYRYDQQSPDWVGYAVASVLGISPSDAPGKRKIGQIIDKWIETGVVEKFDAPDERRKPKSFVRAEYRVETDD